MKLLFIAWIGLIGFNPITTNESTKAVDTAESTIVWTGKKVTGSHTGTLALKEGNLVFDGDVLVGGGFVIDMTSLANTDLDGGMNGKLVGHLKSPDFFSVEEFPTASFSITGVEGSTVTGDLTIKGITNSISFDANLGDDSATATISVDRTKFDVKYGSGSFFDNLGDKAINDNFDLEVVLAY